VDSDIGGSRPASRGDIRGLHPHERSRTCACALRAVADAISLAAHALLRRDLTYLHEADCYSPKPPSEHVVLVVERHSAYQSDSFSALGHQLECFNRSPPPPIGVYRRCRHSAIANRFRINGIQQIPPAARWHAALGRASHEMSPFYSARHAFPAPALILSRDFPCQWRVRLSFSARAFFADRSRSSTRAVCGVDSDDGSLAPVAHGSACDRVSPLCSPVSRLLS